MERIGQASFSVNCLQLVIGDVPCETDPQHTCRSTQARARIPTHMVTRSTLATARTQGDMRARPYGYGDFGGSKCGAR